MKDRTGSWEFSSPILDEMRESICRVTVSPMPVEAREGVEYIDLTAMLTKGPTQVY